MRERAKRGWREDLAALRVLVALAVVCVVCLVANHSLPLVRNGIVYARAAEHVIEHGYDGLAVVADSRLSYDKPVGFAWLAAPLVAAFGTNLGLELVSCAGTLLYLAALLAFARGFDQFGLDARGRALVVLFGGFGPIVAYQSWSAHPDSLYAALYVFVFVLTHRFVEQPRAVNALSIAALVFASLMLKNYGAILLPSIGLYALLHARRILAAPGGKRAAAVLAGALLLLGLLVVLGLTGHNVMMRIEGGGGGAEQYGAGVWWQSCVGTLTQTGVTLLVNVHVALVPALFARGWPWKALLSFPAPYVAGLMLLPTSFYNMRYFIPLLPFGAVLAATGLRGFARFPRRVLVGGFGALAGLLVGLYDCAPLYARIGGAIPRLELMFDWQRIRLSLLDNLRMPMHIAQKEWIHNLNREVEPGGLVYMLDVSYYGDAQQGVFERAGSIRSDIRTRYVSSRDFAPEEKTFWMLGRLRDAKVLARFGTVRDLGHNLRRVE